ncbi:EcoKI restriction-modification system protein HsdS [Turicibacter sanguinis]|nr:EcoKI restriction-modification system protein HsdS [Turicibacter sanguinis]
MSNWEEMILGDYIDLIPGYAFSSDLFNDSIGMPLIRIRDFESQNPITYYSGEYDGKYIVNPGDKLISMDGEFNIIEWKGPCSLLNQRVCKIQSNNNEKMDIQFLMYRLVRELKNIEARTPATTVKHLSLKDLQFLKLSIPPLKEQQKIAEILSSVDAAIEKTEQVIAKTEEVKKGLMQQILTKGIGHTEFKQTEIGEIPVGWNVINLEEICSLITYGFTNPMPTTDEGPYMITAKDIRDGDIQYKTARKTSMECYSNDLTDKSRPSIGDILITKDGTLGRLAIVKQEDICINQSVARIVLKDINLVKYIYYLLDSPQVQTRILAESGGSTIKHIYITKLAKTLIPISTDVEEIKNITNILDSYDYKISSEKRKCNYLINIKKGLMQQLLTGQVRVKID